MRKLTIIDHDSLAVSTGIRDHFIAQGAVAELVPFTALQSGELALEPGVFLWRVSESFHGESQTLQRELDTLGTLINSADTLKLCSEKWLTHERLREHGLATIPTVRVEDFNRECIEEQVRALEFDRRDFSDSSIVLKPNVGAGGAGVTLLEDLKELPAEGDWLAQPFYLAGPESQTRIQVTGGELTGATHRFPAGDTWLNNVTAGGTSSLASVPEALWELASASAAAAGAFYAGVDTVTGASGQHYVLELNSSPGVAGLEVNGVKAIQHIAEMLLREVTRLSL